MGVNLLKQVSQQFPLFGQSFDRGCHIPTHAAPIRGHLQEEGFVQLFSTTIPKHVLSNRGPARRSVNKYVLCSAQLKAGSG